MRIARGMLVTLCTLCMPALAVERELVVWGISQHLNRAPAGRTWNESNPGLGLRVFIPHPGPLEYFVEADYIVRNSTGGSLALVGAGLQRPLYTTRSVQILLGGMAGVGRYENTWENRIHTFPGAYPFVAFRQAKTTVTFGYVPRIKRENGAESHETVFVNAGIRW